VSGFLTKTPWQHQRPRALVVACSDGRLQQNLDEFLSESLNITQYDRLYVPGGPGALVTSGLELLRPDQVRKEMLFLIAAHQIEEVVLVFHAPAADGPDDAMCGDYKRRLPGRTTADLRAQQERDARDVARTMFPPGGRVRLRMFRCEVTRDGRIQLAPLSDGR
jgi:hypothetical protein